MGKTIRSNKVQERIEKTKQKLLLCLEKKLGVVSEACRLAKVSRFTHYKYMKEDEEYKRKVEELTEVAIDFVENKLFENVKGGDSSLIKFYLTTKARHRGYVLKEDRHHEHKIDLDEGQKIEWRITSPSRVNEKAGNSNGHNFE